MDMLVTKYFYYEDDGIIPNNPELAVILYSEVFKEKTAQVERIFNSHNWRNSWTNGVFDYHHYHSNVHEVLGVTRGTATLHLGGEQGNLLVVVAGDVLVLPAGTGHKKVSSSFDFQVVGAYPNGMDYNLLTGLASDRPKALAEIKRVPLPQTDPVFGDHGPLTNTWKS
jgi:uncharacterized protein YjlB